ncbi:unnamed protein product [Urochloa humidicola]
MATIQINRGTYHVVDIDYTNTPATPPSFQVVDANLDLHSSCPVPRGDHLPYLGADPPYLNAGNDVRNTNDQYKPMDCLSTSSSFIYVLLSEKEPSSLADVEASCGYLAMIPLGGDRDKMALENATFADIVRFMRYGFAVRFPVVDKFKGVSWGR